MRTLRGVFSIFLGTTLILSASNVMSAEAEPLKVDFRYSPHWWQTSICLPDDWQKTLVGKEGTLLYDWPGKFSGFKTRISLDLLGGTKWVRQELASPRVPIIRTIRRSGPIEIVEEAFAVAPPLGRGTTTASERLGFGRIGKDTRELAWTAPKVRCDPAFANIAVGWQQPVRYRFRAAGAGEYTVVFGLCEGHHKEKGKRILDLKIEGKTRKTVDMVAEKGANIPGLFPLEARDENGDGWIEIAVAANPDSPDRNAFLNVVWVFAGKTVPPTSELLQGKSSRPVLVHHDCGLSQGPARNDVLVAHLRNRGQIKQTIEPVVVVESQMPIRFDPREQAISVGARLSITCTHAPANLESVDGKRVWKLGKITLAPGEETALAVGVAIGRPRILAPRDVGAAKKFRRSAQLYWDNLDLPYDRIQVPDKGIEALVQSSIRNIWQAREIKNGLPAFQVGPTVYRGLWVVDGSFILEAATYLGAVEDVRRGIEYLLSHQREDGGFTIIRKYWKESGIVLWAVTRHARLTGDKEWLRGHWPKLERAFAFILNLRDQASQDPKAPNYRLLPPGFPDGGLGGRDAPEYTNIYWTMVGMRSAIDAARWLGKDEEADDWQKEYDDFYAAFRKAAARDMRTDPHGNKYLPILMGNKGNHLPQRAQWAFCHAVFPGRIFPAADPLVLGNMAMLEATEREGMVYGTGWMKDGLWNYFASFYGHAWLWLGHGRKAAAVLYAFANHASPLLVWCEEQSLVDAKKPEKHGDMPHNWASAEFIRLVRHMLVLERGNELHLFEGFPAEWARPGAVTRLNHVLTEFGPLSLELRVADDGRSARLKITPPQREPPDRLVVHLGGWADRDHPDATIELPPNRPIERQIRLK